MLLESYIILPEKPTGSITEGADTYKNLSF